MLDHIQNLGVLLSCFVTVRKHRTVKAIATHSFRHYERSLNTDMLNHHITAAESDALFQRDYIVGPRPLPPPYADDFVRATAVHLACGLVTKGDVVMMTTRDVGQVDAVLQSSADQTIWLVLHRWSLISPGRYGKRDSDVVVVSADQILEALVWGTAGGGIITLPPKISATWA